MRTKESPRIENGVVTYIVLQCTKAEHDARHGCSFDQQDYDRAQKKAAGKP